MRIGLVAGEASGDSLGGALIEALRRRAPGVRCEGVAGAAMESAGCEALASSEALAVMGLVEPLRELPRLIALRRDLVRRWRAAPPDVFVGIDAPDFNLGLARRLKRSGIPTVHYVSPSVWAWRQGRVRRIGLAVDRVLCLLPFEKAFYDRHGVAADFVGHPLADRLPANPDRAAARRALGIEARWVVAVMPGSRVSEVSRLGPPFAGAAKRLIERYGDIRFVTPTAGPGTRALFTAELESAGLAPAFTVLEGQSEAAITAADAVLLASGTAALEAALLARPVVAAYRLAPLTHAVARLFRLVKVRHFTLPNQLTAQPLVPEFVQGGANAEALATAVQELLDDRPRRAAIEQQFGMLREQLARGASERAAAAVLEVGSRQPPA